MLHALTWEHRVLVAETIISAAIGVWIVFRNNGVYLPNFDRSLFFLLWNAVLFWLLFSGATHNAWQYWAVTAWYLLDTFTVIKNMANPKVRKIEHHGSVVAFAILMVCGLLALIITGA